MGFSNLRTLKVSEFYMFDSVLDALRELLACSPELEVLALLPLDSFEHHNSIGACRVETKDVQVVPLDSLLPRSSTLKRLELNADRIGLPSASSWPALTDLRIRNVISGYVDDWFWPSLSANCVRLECLHVYPLTEAAVAYLLSYEGLGTLQLSPSSVRIDAFSDKDDAAKERQGKLFQAVLPKHRKTLRHLIFGDLDFPEYGINLAAKAECERFKGILECSNLETLRIIYFYPDLVDHPRITISPVRALKALIRGLAGSCPRLMHLAIQPKRPLWIGFGNMAQYYSDQTKAWMDFQWDLKQALQKSRVEFRAEIEVIEKM